MATNTFGTLIAHETWKYTNGIMRIFNTIVNHNIVLDIVNSKMSTSQVLFIDFKY